jgi:hypothetical protein
LTYLGGKMDLIDGLELYKKDEEFWIFTLSCEEKAKEIIALLEIWGNNPNEDSLKGSKEFLIQVERWKAMCISDRMGNAERNKPKSIWNALRGALSAKTDLETLNSIMQLKGFGSSYDEEYGQRRAKVATSLLRFLLPVEWGVVDWRNAAMVSILRIHKLEVDIALKYAKKYQPSELRETFNIIDEFAATEINDQYRTMRNKQLPRAADVDMALFGLSLMAWPIMN